MASPAIGVSFLLLLILLESAFAQEASGFLEVRGLAYPGVEGKAWQLVERVRPTLEAELGERALLSTTVEGLLTQGRDPQQVFQDLVDDTLAESPIDLFEAYGCSWPDPARNTFFGVDTAADYLSVERLYLDLYTKPMDLRIGRQAVRWGSALMINPTDPFPEVLFTEPWRFRRGVNAVRSTIPIKGGHQVQVVAGLDDAFVHPRFATRATLNAVGTDFSVIGAYRGENDDGIVGLDIRGTLGVGFWFEGALHIGEDTLYEELAVGVDYSFPVMEQLLVAAQYYRYGDGAATWDPAALAGRLGAGTALPVCANEEGEALLYDALGADPDATPDPFAPVFGGRDYVLVLAQAGIIPEVSANVAALQNVGDGTGIAIPTVTTLPTSWWEISFSAQIPYRLYGSGGEFKPPDEDLQVGGQDLSVLLPDATLILWSRASF